MRAALIVLLAVCGLVASMPGLNGNGISQLQFNQFMKRFGKTYATAEERQLRFNNFVVNMQRLARHRAEMRQNNVDWQVGVTKFFDLAPEEFQKYTGGRKYDAAQLATSCLAGGVTAPQLSAEALPSSWDWRTKGVVSPIKNQGQCGSCWAFSTISVIESAWALKGNPLTQFSEQEIVDCSHGCSNEPPYGDVCNQGCDGGWPWNAFSDVVTWKGLQTEAAYPYTAYTGTCHQKLNTLQGVITNYTCITQSHGNIANEDQMAAYLVLHGPLSIAMDATILETYTSGIITPYAGQCSQVQLDHAIVIVGYGTGANNQSYWIVRNSWGEDWGEEGYFRIVKGQNACGLASAVSAPIV
jgi:cathepsin F